ncbi:MAG: MBOAT family O-acyltransferase [Eubacteriales bacterium]|jgi:alginate O-acetyltransferase complex protein AlgI
MLFNSVEFLIFFPVVTIVFFLLPERFRRYWLLAASCFFYMSFIPYYIIILLFTTCVDFFGALLIGKYHDRPELKNFFFALALGLNIGLLVYFKYLGMLGGTFNFISSAFGGGTLTVPDVVLPIGISFHTFQSMGYLIDTYRANEAPEKNFINFSLFLMFFPQLVAGPIERFGDLSAQLKKSHRFTYENVSIGGRIMLWGMFKKIAVADNLAKIADLVFGDVASYAGWPAIIGLLCFSVQIYCDFSGYSDIAKGAAQILDIRLMENFKTPYFSTSPGEFWRRWHISLSTWFRDYIYFPMGGSRVSTPRWVLNNMVTFAVSGIWHGANWTFAFWGLLNGILVISGRLLKPFGDMIGKLTSGALGYVPLPEGVKSADKLPAEAKAKYIESRGGKLWAGIRHVLALLSTFAVISVTWIFFRADNFRDAFKMFGNIFLADAGDFSSLPSVRLWACALCTFLLIAVELIFTYTPVQSHLDKISRGEIASSRRATAIRLFCYAVIIAVIVLFGAYDNRSFIYFQF